MERLRLCKCSHQPLTGEAGTATIVTPSRGGEKSAFQGLFLGGGVSRETNLKCFKLR